MVSIIVPVYNREATIGKCVESIIGQSYDDLDVILVDDGSTDRSGEICDSFANLDKRIRAFHIDNSGVANARNYGIEKSKGEYITFVDSDDYIDKEYISKLYSAFEVDGCVMSVCNYNEEVNGFRYLRSLYNIDSCTSYDYIEDILYCRAQGGLCWGKLYKKDLIKSLFESFKYCEDVLFVFDYLASNNGIISIVNDPLYCYVRHDKSITGGRKASDLDDAVSVADNIYEKCKNKKINHLKAAEAFLVSNSLFAFLQNRYEESNEGDCLRKRVKKVVAGHRKFVMLDKHSTIKTKGACFISIFSYRLLSFMYGFIT